MTGEATLYYLYGDIPVVMERTSSGGLRVSAFNPRTRSFVLDPSYRNAIFHDRDGLARPVTRATFDAHVQTLGGPETAHPGPREGALESTRDR